MIELRDIVKSYQMGEATQTVLHGVSLDIYKNDLLAIMGASGSGKSTLMNIIGLLDRPNSGSYHLHGREVSTLQNVELAQLRNETIGFVFQQFFLLPRLTAEQNVGLPLTYRQMSQREIKPLVMAMLDRVGMADRAHHRPSELSGGQQQRVAIARALIGKPALILADEPTGALDTKTGDEVMELFLNLNRDENTTVVIITHDPDIAKQCRRCIHISDGNILNDGD